jgi:hypothetical protein
MNQIAIKFLSDIGFLRSLLGLGALVVILFVPAPGTRVMLHGYEMINTLLFPTLAPLIFMVLLLDTLITRVMMIDSVGSATQRLRLIIWFDLALATLIAVRWYGFFAALWQ